MDFLQKIIIYLVSVPGILISITVHEYTKALTSTMLGDELPKVDKRLTLNPFKHFEAIGFILFFICGFGWGNPVRTSALHYKDRKKGTLLTYTMPIVANLIFAFLFLGVVEYFENYLCYDFEFFLSRYASYFSADFSAYFVTYLRVALNYIVIYNISVAVFNILPVYPLCGNKILSALLNPNQSIKMAQNEKIFQMILIFFILFGFLNQILMPIVDFIVQIFEMAYFWI